MTTVQIEKQTYDIIEGTQTDGRCFSASIYFDLYKEKPEDKQLNEWIQTYIIDPILATQNTDCIIFFKWVFLWASSTRHGTNTNNFTMDDDIIKIQYLFDKLDIAINFINKNFDAIDTTFISVVD